MLHSPKQRTHRQGTLHRSVAAERRARGHVGKAAAAVAVVAGGLAAAAAFPYIRSRRSCPRPRRRPRVASRAAGSVVARAAGHAAPPAAAVADAPRDDAAERRDDSRRPGRDLDLDLAQHCVLRPAVRTAASRVRCQP